MRDNNEILVGDLVKMRAITPEPGTPERLTFLVKGYLAEDDELVDAWMMTALSTGDTFRVFRMFLPDDGNHYRLSPTWGDRGYNEGYDDAWVRVEL